MKKDVIIMSREWDKEKNLSPRQASKALSGNACRDDLLTLERYSTTSDLLLVQV